MNQLLRAARLFNVVDHLDAAITHLSLYPNTSQSIELIKEIKDRVGHLIVEVSAQPPDPPASAPVSKPS